MTRDEILDQLDQLAACRKIGDPIPPFLKDGTVYTTKIADLAKAAADFIRDKTLDIEPDTLGEDQ